MLESVCEHPLPRRHLNFKRNRLFPERAAKLQKLKLTYVQYNVRLRHVRENPNFEPVFLPPMVLDPIDSEAAGDFDGGSD
jgi:hypothetical protein